MNYFLNPAGENINFHKLFYFYLKKIYVEREEGGWKRNKQEGGKVQ